MLIRLDDLPEEASSWRKAQVPGARGKPVLAARERKAYFYLNLVHLASSL